ncbi:hypothetical protein BC828DRAFT_389435 [Blastocladiella britannica]|nr:hypothetical protein BC828DRAFT_389435 [Blastocladiella britannica]
MLASLRTERPSPAPVHSQSTGYAIARGWTPSTGSNSNNGNDPPSRQKKRVDRRPAGELSAPRTPARRAVIRSDLKHIFSLPPAPAEVVVRAAAHLAAERSEQLSASVARSARERTIQARASAAPARHHHGGATSLPNKPYTAGSKSHADVAETNAMVRVLETAAFRNGFHDHRRYRHPIACHGTARSYQRRGAPPAYEMHPPLAIPTEYLRRLHDVDVLAVAVRRHRSHDDDDPMDNDIDDDGDGKDSEDDAFADPLNRMMFAPDAIERERSLVDELVMDSPRASRHHRHHDHGQQQRVSPSKPRTAAASTSLRTKSMAHFDDATGEEPSPGGGGGGQVAFGADVDEKERTNLPALSSSTHGSRAAIQRSVTITTPASAGDSQELLGHDSSNWPASSPSSAADSFWTLPPSAVAAAAAAAARGSRDASSVGALSAPPTIHKCLSATARSVLRKLQASTAPASAVSTSSLSGSSHAASNGTLDVDSVTASATGQQRRGRHASRTAKQQMMRQRRRSVSVPGSNTPSREAGAAVDEADDQNNTAAREVERRRAAAVDDDVARVLCGATTGDFDAMFHTATAAPAQISQTTPLPPAPLQSHHLTLLWSSHDNSQADRVVWIGSEPPSRPASTSPSRQRSAATGASTTHEGGAGSGLILHQQARITSKWQVTHAMLDALVLMCDTVVAPALTVSVPPSAAASVSRLGSTASSSRGICRSTSLAMQPSRPSVMLSSAVSAITQKHARNMAARVASSGADRVLQNHVAGGVYMMERGTATHHSTNLDGATASTTNLTGGGAGGDDDAAEDFAPSAAGSMDSLAANVAHRRRSVFAEFAASAGVAAAAKAAAVAGAAAVSTIPEGAHDLGESTRDGEPLASEVISSAYFQEASGFLAAIKNMVAKYRSSHLPRFPTALGLDEIANAVEYLDQAEIPTSPPQQSRALPRALLDTLNRALLLAYPPVARSAAKLAWTVTGGRLPSSLVAPCIEQFFGMLEDGSVLERRRAGKALVILGKGRDPRTIRHLANHLGDVDQKLRDAARQALLWAGSMASGCEEEEEGEGVEEKSGQARDAVTQHVVLATVPLLAHSNIAVREDAVAVVAAVAAAWRDAHPDLYAARVIGTHQRVMPDGGDGYLSLSEFKPTIPRLQAQSVDTVASSDQASESAGDSLAWVSILQGGLVRIVQMMLTDWHLPLRDKCAKVMADLDLLPLLLQQVAKMLHEADLVTRRNALKVLTLVRVVTQEAWDAYLALMNDDYLTLRIEACRAACGLAICHSQLIRELLNRLADQEAKVRGLAVKALSLSAVGPRVIFDIFGTVLGFLEQELAPEVKQYGCSAIVRFLARCDEHVRSSAGATTSGSKHSARNDHSAGQRGGSGDPSGSAGRGGRSGESTAPSAQGSTLALATNPAAADTHTAVENTHLNPLSVPSSSRRPSSTGGSTTESSNADLSSAHGTGTEPSRPRSLVEQLAATQVRAQQLLVKWYTSSSAKEEPTVHAASERALTSLGVHAASLAAATADSVMGIGTEADVAAVVATDARRELSDARARQAVVASSQVRQQRAAAASASTSKARSVGDLETAVALASVGATDGDETTDAVVIRRVRQLGTRANVLHQLALLDKQDATNARKSYLAERGKLAAHQARVDRARSSIKAKIDDNKTGRLATAMASHGRSTTPGAAAVQTRPTTRSGYTPAPVEDTVGSGDDDDGSDVDYANIFADKEAVLAVDDAMVMGGNPLAVRSFGSSAVSRRQSINVMAPITARIAQQQQHVQHLQQQFQQQKQQAAPVRRKSVAPAAALTPSSTGSFSAGGVSPTTATPRTLRHNSVYSIQTEPTISRQSSYCSSLGTDRRASLVVGGKFDSRDSEPPLSLSRTSSRGSTRGSKSLFRRESYALG